MTPQDVEKFQEDCIQRGKEDLQSTGRLIPLTFVLAQRMNVDEFLRSKCVDTKSFKRIEDDGSKPLDYIMLTFLNEYDDPASLLFMLEYIAEDREKFKKDVVYMMETGKLHKVKDPAKTIINVFFSLNNIQGKDIFAEFIKQVCKNTEAAAFVKNDESWVRMYSGLSQEEARKELKKYPGKLENDPNSTEALMSYLETKTLKRMILQPFTREVRGTGKVASFGEKQVTDNSFTGRFCNLLNETRDAIDLDEDVVEERESA